MATLTVGPGKEYETVSAAVAAARDGDVIKVAAGTYTNDFPTIDANITIEGVGGMVNMVATQSPPNGKAIMDIAGDVTLYNVAFSGAAVPDGNGAGIRYESGNLTISHCYFFDNQDGLLAADDPTGSITITDSEFSHNGAGDGFTHNLYVGQIGTLTVTGSYFHDAVVGHEIKSRALTTIIENNRIEDGPNGNASYEIDVPNGGNVTIQNNVIQKGPNAQNPYFISDGEEGDVYASSALTVSGNTVLNDFPGAIAMVHDLSGGSVAITDNEIFGLAPSAIYSGGGSPIVSGNTVLAQEPALDSSDPFLPVVPFKFSVCFAGGTRILSDQGEIPVERLRPGERVITVETGIRVSRPVKWIGHRRLDLTVHPQPDAVAPIRIARGAIAAEVPHRDLLLSPDHALYLDGMLVPARQLINGGTIRQDSAVRAVRYVHVELDAHAVILAEGAGVESYLDTGNRDFFANATASPPPPPRPDHAGAGTAWRIAASCVPFRVDEAAVWPVWRRLADRSADLGWGEPARAATLDPNLRVLAGARRARPMSSARDRHVFLLPDHRPGHVVPHCPAEVRLLSHAAAPADCRPWLSDRRRLGIPVSRIVLHGSSGVLEIPLDHPSLRRGWWPPESNGDSLFRWTDGNATLPLPRDRMAAVLEIHLAGQMEYPRAVPPDGLSPGR